MIRIADLVSSETFQRMNSIERFNGVPKIKSETIGQHSWWVTFYSKVLFDMILPFNPEWEYMQQVYHKDLKISVLENGIVHDVPEIFTGDVLYDLKYNELNGREIKKLVEDYELHIVDKTFSGTGVSTVLRNQIHRYYVNTSDLCNRIIKVADWLSCITYEYCELMMGNRYFESKIYDISLQGLLYSSQSLLTGFTELYPYDLQDINIAFIKDELIGFSLPNPNRVNKPLP